MQIEPAGDELLQVLTQLVQNTVCGNAAAGAELSSRSREIIRLVSKCWRPFCSILPSDASCNNAAGPVHAAVRHKGNASAHRVCACLLQALENSQIQAAAADGSAVDVAEQIRSAPVLR